MPVGEGLLATAPQGLGSAGILPLPGGKVGFRFSSASCEWSALASTQSWCAFIFWRITARRPRRLPHPMSGACDTGIGCDVAPAHLCRGPSRRERLSVSQGSRTEQIPRRWMLCLTSLAQSSALLPCLLHQQRPTCLLLLSAVQRLRQMVAEELQRPLLQRRPL